MNSDASDVQSDKSLSYLLYLYLWPFCLFENVNMGSLFERAAVYRRNRSRRVYLPGYLVKWAAIFDILMVVLSTLETIGSTYSAWKFSFILLACGTGILATVAFVVVVMIIAAYLLLTQWEY